MTSLEDRLQCRQCNQWLPADLFGKRRNHRRCRPCRMANQRKRYAEDTEFRKMKQACSRQWRDRTRKEYNASRRESRVRNPEVREKARTYWSRNRDRFRELHRHRMATDPAYREAYREKNRAAAQRVRDKWTPEEREAHRVACAQRKAQNRERYCKQKNEHRLAQSYGLSIAKVEAMHASQGDACAICGKKRGRKRLNVDHDHDTGQVRGLLCPNCNIGLGKLGDNAEGVKRAIRYLKMTAKRVKS